MVFRLGVFFEFGLENKVVNSLRVYRFIFYIREVVCVLIVNDVGWIVRELY